MKVHHSAVVERGAILGDRCRIWHDVHIREGASLGENVSVGKGAYIDVDVIIGDGTKIQNYACIYRGVELAEEVFIGPHACFTNDREPRAVGQWEVVPTKVCQGASIGANATVVCGVIIGRHAMIGAGTVVTHDVPNHGKVVGNPGHLVGFVCYCGEPLQRSLMHGDNTGFCPACAATIGGIRWELVQPSL